MKPEDVLSIVRKLVTFGSTDDIFGEIAFEIFDVEGHNREWPATTEELDEIVESYDPAFLEAPLKLDHVDHGPAGGFIKRIWREGTKLMASVGELQEWLRDAINSKQFKSRSVEFLKPGHSVFPEKSDKAGKPYLYGLAFLGAAVPAVKGMAPLPMFAQVNMLPEVACFSENLNPPEKPGGSPDPKPNPTLQETKMSDDKIAALQTQVEEFKVQITDKDKTIEGLQSEIASFKEAMEKHEADEKARLEKEKDDRIEGWMDNLEKDGKTTPADRAKFMGILKNLPDDQANDLYNSLYNTVGRIPMGERTHNTPAPSPDNVPIADDNRAAFHARVKEIEQAKKVSFKEATDIALREQA